MDVNRKGDFLAMTAQTSAMALAFAIVVASCASPHGIAPRSSASALLPVPAKRSFVVVRPTDGELGYSGTLTDEGLDALHRAYDDRVHRLLIRSGGGEIGVGTEFGEWVRDRDLDVVVVDYCLSSCANYVFTAGRKKTILPGAIVAWHGNSRQRSFEDQPSRDALTEIYAADVREREDALFARVRVSECICRIGEERGAPGFFTMSPADMARFGVTDVSGGPMHAGDAPPAMREALRLSFLTFAADDDVRRACP